MGAELEGQTAESKSLKKWKKKKQKKEISRTVRVRSAPRDMDHNTCQFLQPNLERKACFAVLCCSSIHTCLFDFTLCSHRDPNLPPKKPHRLVWVEAQPLIFYFFSCKISFHARVTVRAAVPWMLHMRTDAMVGKKKNALCVLSDSQDINKQPC